MTEQNAVRIPSVVTSDGCTLADLEVLPTELETTAVLEVLVEVTSRLAEASRPSSPCAPPAVRVRRSADSTLPSSVWTPPSASG